MLHLHPKVLTNRRYNLLIAVAGDLYSLVSLIEHDDRGKTTNTEFSGKAKIFT
ncbi:MAG: hypothetical protein FWJ66_03925 [Caldibacillus sp.]